MEIAGTKVSQAELDAYEKVKRLRIKEAIEDEIAWLGVSPTEEEKERIADVISGWPILDTYDYEEARSIVRKEN